MRFNEFKQTLNEGITHIEELPIDEFIQAIKNLNMYEITEKVDGANVQFGIDNNGKFFTSREGKGGNRYYSVADWGNKFWETGFKSAHSALEPIAKKVLKPGETVEAEILFGELPNTVPYSGDKNQIILLRPIEGTPNIERIADKLEGYTTTITLDKVPYTEDGETIQYRPEEHVWTITKTPYVPSESLTKQEATTEITKRIKELEAYLKQEIQIDSISMPIPELLAIKFNQRPEKIDQATWQDLKEKIKTKREEILQHIQSLQLNVKDVLLNHLVRKVRSKFGPELDNGGWIEGVVMRHKDTGKQFKLVDKSVFTALNTFYHEIISQITDHRAADGIKNTLMRGMASSIGHPNLGTTAAKKYIQSHGKTQQEVLTNLGHNIDVNQTKTTWLKLINDAKQRLEKLLKDYKKSNRNINLNINNKDRMFSHTGAASKKTLQTFAEFKQFLNTTETAIQQATTGGDLVNILVGDKLKAVSESKLTEGGHAVPNAGAITREEIPPTIQKLSSIINIPAIMLKSNMLGSAGKTALSGDIDIALDENTYHQDELHEKLKATLGESNVKILHGFNIVSISFPIENYDDSIQTDKPRTGRVQIDLMLGKPNWLKFGYFSAGDRSEYKGLFRTVLLIATAASFGQAVLNKDNEIVGKLGPVFLLNLGVRIQAKKRKYNKKGEMLKGEEKVSLNDFKREFPEADIDRYGNKFVIDEPNEVAKFLFGDVKPNITASDLDTFEEVIALIKQKPTEIQNFIKAKATERLKAAGHDFPEDLI
ncbi:MAG: hypothetical protein HC836_37640 [Richelia sp. RM2_1_2]|nr:hypothetical protein [Richelia sp. RM2_1_2]